MGSSTLDAGVVRTYHGRTIQELLGKIQDELGPDAIIVHRREGLTGGVAGFFQRPYVEIDAIPGGPRIDVYDEEPLAPLPPRHEEPIAPSAPRTAPSATAPSSQSPPQTGRAPYQPVSPRAPARALSPPPHTPFYEREPPHAGPGGRYVTGHLAELAQSNAPHVPVSEGHELSTRPLAHTDAAEPFVRVLQRATSVERAAPTPTRPAQSTTRPKAPPRTRARGTLQSRLVNLGVSPHFAEETIDAALAHVLALAPRTPLAKAVGEALKQRIPVAPPLPAQGAAIVLVGPGGAGKTSCCAALLAAYRANSTLRASCATLVRGQGKEWQLLLSPQLRKPVAANSDRATRALRKAKAEGLLVIDTPPLSPGESGPIHKLGALLGLVEPERVTVAMPATLGEVAAAQLMQALRPLKANALALTHAAETDQVGVAVEAACKFGLAPEYTLERARAGGWRLRRIDPTGLAATLLP